MRVGCATFLAGLLALTGCEARMQAQAEQPCVSMPAVAAHRGGTERSLENTLGAFRSAGAAGIKLWELDVRFDVNGTPVVLHDSTVDRVSPLTGPVAKLDALDPGIPTDDGQYVPTLRAVYDLAQQYNAHVLTELKVMPTEPQWRAVADQIDQSIGRSSVTLMAFGSPIVLQEKARFPGTEVGLLNGAGFLHPEQIHKYGDSYMQWEKSINAGRAAAWHAAGIKLYAWTVDDPAAWERLSAWPVDVIITNKPIGYERWAGKRCRPVASDR